MQVFKEGIEKTIKEKDLGEYLRRGYIQVGGEEKQPLQENIKPVDDFVVRPAKKKKTKKGE